MTRLFFCPLNAEAVAHPCPVRACPANFADTSPDNSCAHLLDSLDYSQLALISGLETNEVKRQSHDQTVVLGERIRDLKHAVDHVVDLETVCRNCGYIEPCRSQTLCAERAFLVDQIRVKLWGKQQTELKRNQIWWAVVNGADQFLTDKDRFGLRELLSKNHAGVK